MYRQDQEARGRRFLTKKTGFFFLTKVLAKPIFRLNKKRGVVSLVGRLGPTQNQEEVAPGFQPGNVIIS
jgi:hypothetical protein